MTALPFQLFLTTRSGWSNQTLATFAEWDDLLIFWRAWCASVSPETISEARFCHEGRRVGVCNPNTHNEAQLADWAAACHRNA